MINNEISLIILMLIMGLVLTLIDFQNTRCFWYGLRVSNLNRIIDFYIFHVALK